MYEVFSMRWGLGERCERCGLLEGLGLMSEGGGIVGCDDRVLGKFVRKSLIYTLFTIIIFVLFSTNLSPTFLLFHMFILNALCCSSDSSHQSITIKTKPIKKALTEHTADINIIPSAKLIEKTSMKDDELHARFMTDGVTDETLNKVGQLQGQMLGGDVSDAGTNVKCLGGSRPDGSVSHVSMSQISSDYKQNQPLSVSSKTLNGADFIDIDVKQWSVKDVLKFLSKIGMRNYNTTFYKNKIKGKDLVSLSQKQLRQDLQIHDKDIKTLTLYIQLLKQRVNRQSKQKGLSRSFSGRRRGSSFYKSFSNTYSSRRILTMVKNPIIEEDGEEEHPENYQIRGNLTTKDMYSTTNFSDLLTN